MIRFYIHKKAANKKIPYRIYSDISNYLVSIWVSSEDIKTLFAYIAFENITIDGDHRLSINYTSTSGCTLIHIRKDYNGNPNLIKIVDFIKTHFNLKEHNKWMELIDDEMQIL